MCCVNELLHAVNITSDGKHSNYIVRRLRAVLDRDYFNSVVLDLAPRAPFVIQNVFLSVLDKPSPI